MNNFEETKTEIIEFIESKRMVSLFEGRSERIKSIIMKIFDCIEKLNNDEVLNEDDEHTVTIDELSVVIDVLMYTSLERQTTQKDNEIIKHIAILVFNYNQNVFKSEFITIRASFISSFIDGYLTYRDCLSIFKSLIDRLKQYSTYQPPSFELAKHYINSIFDDNENNCKE